MSQRIEHSTQANTLWRRLLVAGWLPCLPCRPHALSARLADARLCLCHMPFLPPPHSLCAPPVLIWGFLPTGMGTAVLACLVGGSVLVILIAHQMRQVTAYCLGLGEHPQLEVSVQATGMADASTVRRGVDLETLVVHPRRDRDSVARASCHGHGRRSIFGGRASVARTSVARTSVARTSVAPAAAACEPLEADPSVPRRISALRRRVVNSSTPRVLPVTTSTNPTSARVRPTSQGLDSAVSSPATATRVVSFGAGSLDVHEPASASKEAVAE